MTSKSPEDGLAAQAAHAVYERTSRRGLLARASAMLVAVGAGGALTAAAAEADAPACCTGHNCKAGGGSCPGVGTCPSGWTYTGYTWTCCQGHYLVYCSDCRSDTTGVACGCAYRSRQSCARGLTATETSERIAR